MQQGHRWCKAVKVVVSDGSRAYKAAIDAHLGHARHVLDRFHVIRWFAAGLTQVRRDVQRREPKGVKPAFDPEVFKARFKLLRRGDTLTGTDRARLDKLFDAHPRLRAGWQALQELHGLYTADDYDGALEALGRFCDLYENGELPEHHDTVDTFIAWSDEILNWHCAGRPSNGRIEETDNLLQVLRRSAHGFTNPLNFEARGILVDIITPTGASNPQSHEYAKGHIFGTCDRAVARIRWQGRRPNGDHGDRETIDIVRVDNGTSRRALGRTHLKRPCRGLWADPTAVGCTPGTMRTRRSPLSSSDHTTLARSAGLHREPSLCVQRPPANRAMTQAGLGGGVRRPACGGVLDDCHEPRAAACAWGDALHRCAVGEAVGGGSVAAAGDLAEFVQGRGSGRGPAMRLWRTRRLCRRWRAVPAASPGRSTRSALRAVWASAWTRRSR